MSSPEERMGILSELGQEVQIRREELGLTYDDIYDRTRIQPSYLYAIENAEYEILPDAVYTLGFIRTYLGILEFDEIYPEFRQWLLASARPSVKDRGKMLPYASHPPGFKLASRFWIFVVLLLIVVGAMTYATYSLSQNGIPNIAPRSESRPGFIMVNNDVSSDTESGYSSGNMSASVSMDASMDASMDISRDIPVSDPEPIPEPRKPELQITADDDCWISIRVGNGRIVDRTLKKGETFSMELTEMTRVSYGRPWAVTVIHNGKDIGTPYKSGAKKPQVNLYYPDGRSGRIESNRS